MRRSFVDEERELNCSIGNLILRKNTNYYLTRCRRSECFCTHLHPVENSIPYVHLERSNFNDFLIQLLRRSLIPNAIDNLPLHMVFNLSITLLLSVLDDCVGCMDGSLISGRFSLKCGEFYCSEVSSTYIL